MPQVESKMKVLESDQQALLGDAPKADDDEEFVDLSKDTTGLDLEDDKAAPAKDKTVAPAKKETPPADAADDEELPPELKGKTAAQIAKMYRDAQSVIGRQGSELGDFRKKADILIQASLANIQEQRAARQKEAAPAAPKEEPLDESEIFAKPSATIAKMIENHPLIKELRGKLGDAAADREADRVAASTERFRQAHPDAETILKDQEFREWVGASRVRTALLNRANSKFDFDAGDEVFSTWKALRAVKAKDKDEAPSDADTAASDAGRALAARAKAKREQALKDAAAPTQGGGAPKQSGSKKVYRRADVIKLMETDPERYERMSDEIALAYKEGRVK